METSQILLIIFSLCTTAAVIVLAIIFAQASNDRDDEAHQKNVCEGNLRQARSDLNLARDYIDELETNTLSVNCGNDVINNTCQTGMVLVAKTLGDELGLKVTLIRQGTSVGTSTASYGSTPNVFVVATTSNPKGSKSKNVTNIQAVSGITALKKITKYWKNEPIISFKIENPDGTTNVHQGSDPHIMEFVNAFNDRVPKVLTPQTIEGYTEPLDSKPKPTSATRPKPSHMIGGPSGVYHGPYDIPFDTVGRDVMRVKTKESYSCGSMPKSRWRRK